VREQLWLVAARVSDQGGSTEKPYAFRHALFRQVLYDRLAPSARAELHRKVGAALEQERSMKVAVPAAELALHFERGRMHLAALRYYAEAAEAALLHVSPAECMSLTDRAFSLVDQAPADSERNSLEIALATLRGVAAFHLLGAGDEARNAYLRGASLLATVPQHPMRGLLLHGLGFLHNLRAEYSEAIATAERADALASDASDASLALAAHTARGQAYMHQGHPQAARQSLERALPAIEIVHAASEQTFIGFIADPQVTVLGMLSLQLVHVGSIRQSRELLHQAYSRARQLAQPMALLVTIWFDTLCQIRFGEVDRVAALAEELRSLVDRFALAQGVTASRWFRGWADARRGKPLEGFRQIRGAYEKNRALGMIAGSSETLGYAAEALLLHGDLGGAEEQLRQAFEIVNTHAERIYLPQLLLTQGAIARARGQHAQADASIRHAISESRAQEAIWLELLALTELCAHSTASSEDRRTLSALIDRLGEARDTTALARAQALVADTLSP
jgi:tetratricopeptide (TPR) repeat protein